MKIKNDILGYKDRTLYQDTKMFSFTLDSVLVSRFINLNSKIKTIVDFGTNNAVIPLIVSKYTKAYICGVEIQEQAVQLAQENVVLNKLDGQIEIICADVKNFAKTNRHKFDAVICNPPFFKMDGSPKTKALSQEVVNARHETLITLEEIIHSASQVLRNGGSFTIVHRAERAGEIINLFYQNKLIPKRIRFVHSKKDQKAKTVLIDAILNGNEGMSILPPLIAHNSDETYTDELLEMFRD
ncbi:tRNA1(Val) (adenine(37)-N6)-methyltransferase [Williamsoniiplasma luminosum]|uniref:SAM-dependent methyltransferase n=1 Tax=Williamsoniiplasma luminosum TaxID=214888 RepID=A0A2S0NKL0_9MOLU|nr:tRNA1(Val) (adenine(37)-N6)-methyltransferase [Williamsoniiplasma luminosum]AVP49549.1 MAG: SAM-dependent methyltransferase [Williamsoniiplasma luminosum]